MNVMATVQGTSAVFKMPCFIHAPSLTTFTATTHLSSPSAAVSSSLVKVCKPLTQHRNTLLALTLGGSEQQPGKSMHTCDTDNMEPSLALTLGGSERQPGESMHTTDTENMEPSIALTLGGSEQRMSCVLDGLPLLSCPSAPAGRGAAMGGDPGTGAEACGLSGGAQCWGWRAALRGEPPPL